MKSCTSPLSSRRSPRTRLPSFVFVGALFALGASGCKSEEPAKSAEDAEGKPKEDKAAALAGAPAWVTSDCREHFSDNPVVCGVGAVSGVSSPSLSRNAAMGRGRTEIARYLQIEVKSILRDYQAAKGAVIEQKIEEESTQIAEMTLVGSRMASYFIAPDGTYYALMVLGYDDFKGSIEGASHLEPSLRDALIQNSQKAFSSRDDETSRY